MSGGACCQESLIPYTSLSLSCRLLPMTMNMEQLIDFFPQTFGTEAFCLSGSFHFFVPKLFNENVSSRVLTFLGLVRGEFNHGFLGFCPEGSKLKDRGTKEQSWDSWTSSSLSSLAALFPSLFISRYTGCSNRTCVPTFGTPGTG